MKSTINVYGIWEVNRKNQQYDHLVSNVSYLNNPYKLTIFSDEEQVEILYQQWLKNKIEINDGHVLQELSQIFETCQFFFRIDLLADSEENKIACKVIKKLIERV